MKKQIWDDSEMLSDSVSTQDKISDKTFIWKMTASFLMIIFCTVILIASTSALFFEDVSVKTSRVTGAYYTVTVDQATGRTYTSPLVTDDMHYFKITGAGTASTGYCEICISDPTGQNKTYYYTAPIAKDQSLSLTIQAAENTVITFTPQWGPARTDICGTVITHSQTPSTTYLVEPTAKLESIAAYYGIPAEDILTYNGIYPVATMDLLSENTVPILTVGTELRIPRLPAETPSYRVPYATYTVEPTATLEQISAHYGISVSDIAAFNDLSDYGYGKEVKIPNTDPTFPAFAVPYVSYLTEPAARLSEISLYYGISEQDILLYNGISTLTAGTELRIPGISVAITPYTVPYAVYVMEPTATVDALSAHYGISVSDILAFNALAEYPVGQPVKIPYADPNLPDYAVPFVTYVVEPAAKLANISAYYGISETDICLYNGISDLTTGMALRIPGVSGDIIIPYAVPYSVYVMEPTAMIETVAAYYGISLSDILAFNGLSFYPVGQLVKIPNADPNVPPYAVPYATYIVEPAAKLTKIATYYGVSETDILLYNNTTAISTGMLLKIPGVLGNVTPYTVPYSVYTVEPTASIHAIATHYGVPADDIIAFNGQTNYVVGQMLKIPNADPTLPTYAVPYVTYVVEPAARIAEIAKHYGVSANDILQFNGLTELLSGIVLKIPGVVGNVTPYVVPYSVYVMEPTATMAAIGQYYNVAVLDIYAFNALSDYSVGQMIKIPYANTNLPPYAVPFTVYTVEPTATLQGIAAYYHVSEADILTYNNIPSIAIGMALKIPGVAANVPPYVAPVPDTGNAGATTPPATEQPPADNSESEGNTETQPPADDTTTESGGNTSEQPTQPEQPSADSNTDSENSTQADDEI